MRFARGTDFGATLVSANGGFYFQAFNGSVVLPAAGYDYNSDWTPLLAGLSPLEWQLASLHWSGRAPALAESWQGRQRQGARMEIAPEVPAHAMLFRVK
jgi:hypothetical protein